MAERSASFRMYLATASALCSAMAMGCVISWSGTALGSMKKNGSVPLIHTWKVGNVEHVDPDDQEMASWISSCITLGALAGSLIASFIVKFVGCRVTLVSLGLPLLGGWALICYAKNFPQIVIGRIITGFCSGVICSTAPGYVTDIVTPNTRGLLGTGFQIMICTGQLYLICFGTFLEWNTLAYVAIIPVVLCSLGMLLSPESPIRLVELGRTVEAESALMALRGPNSDVMGELKELEDRVETTRAEGASAGCAMLKRADVYHPVIIAIMMMVFQQFSGINAVMFYLKNIFEGGSSIDANVAAIMVDAALVLGTVFTAPYMDRFGRKVWLIVSGLGHVLSLGAMGAYYLVIEHYHHNSGSGPPPAGWVPVVCLMVFVIAFSVGFGPIPWMIVGEITPNEAMPMVSSLGSATNWLCAFVITKEFEALTAAVHKYGAYWLFAACSLLSVLYTVFFVPETKQRSVEDMQRHFLDK